MKNFIKQRDGPARYTMLEIKNKKVKTPNIFFINTNRFKAPDFSDITISNQGKKDDLIVLYSLENKTEKDNYYIIQDAYQLFLNPKNFVDFIIKLRQKIGEEKTIYMPSIGNPTNFALMAYMSIDLFDSTQAIIAARNNNLFFTNGQFNVKDLDEIPCS